MLAVADEVDEGLYANLGPVRAADVVVACGDLPFSYLGYLMNGLDVPLVFVPGNHDPDLSGYRRSRAGLTLRAGMPARAPWPDGAINADGAIVEVAGLRFAGLGGCRRYSEGPNQYSDWQLARRAHALRRRARWRGQRVDVLLTHAPPKGVGDGADPPHLGFSALHGLVRALQPTVLLHGHVLLVDAEAPDRRLGGTAVRNVIGRHLLDIEPGAAQAGGGGAGRPGLDLSRAR
ncbi:MAG: metallophosphoesterase family protein [Streptosporangiaceae bacterium]